jgi:hypothetical protein
MDKKTAPMSTKCNGFAGSIRAVKEKEGYYGVPCVAREQETDRRRDILGPPLRTSANVLQEGWITVGSSWKKIHERVGCWCREIPDVTACRAESLLWRRCGMKR